MTLRNIAIAVPLAIIACNAAAAHGARSGRCVIKLGESVVIGSLSSRVVYGPPNYGEDPQTDSKETIYLLKFDPSCADALGARKIGGNQFQLVGEKVIGVQKFLGKKVVVKGEIFRGETGHHHTRFVLDASNVVAK